MMQSHTAVSPHHSAHKALATLLALSDIQKSQKQFLSAADLACGSMELV